MDCSVHLLFENSVDHFFWMSSTSASFLWLSSSYFSVARLQTLFACFFLFVSCYLPFTVYLFIGFYVMALGNYFRVGLSVIKCCPLPCAAVHNRKIYLVIFRLQLLTFSATSMIEEQAIEVLYTEEVLAIFQA